MLLLLLGKESPEYLASLWVMVWFSCPEFGVNKLWLVSYSQKTITLWDKELEPRFLLLLICSHVLAFLTNGFSEVSCALVKPFLAQTSWMHPINQRDWGGPQPVQSPKGGQFSLFLCSRKSKDNLQEYILMASAKHLKMAEFYPNCRNFLRLLERSGWMRRVNQQRALKARMMGSAVQLTDNGVTSSISWKMRRFWPNYSRPRVLKWAGEFLEYFKQIFQ